MCWTGSVAGAGGDSGLTGSTVLPREAGLVLDGLEVRRADELLARAPVDGRLNDLELYPALERAALTVGEALISQGLIEA